MKIAIAQIEPVKGDIGQNLDNHLRFIGAALEKKVDLIMFPELSLTGYELDLARELTTTSYDGRLTPLQEISDKNNIIIAAGLPTINGHKLFISMIIIQPGKSSVRNSEGELTGQLDSETEGLLIYDTAVKSTDIVKLRRKN